MPPHKPSAERSNGKAGSHVASEPSKALATALLAFHTASAFIPSPAGGALLHASTGSASLTGSRRLALEQQGGLAIYSPVMQNIKGQTHELSPKELAAKCLKQGCPVDTVEEVLAVLKAEGDLSAERSKTINELEILLLEPNKNKNSIQKLLAGVANSHIVPSNIISFLSKEAGRANAPKMQDESHELTLQQLAAKCLDHGCPADAVEELLASLKAEDKLSAELVKIINELEMLLLEPNKNKNSIQKLLAGVANSRTVPSNIIGALSKAVARANAPEMHDFEDESHDLTLQQAAAKCLDQGCPVDTVEELLAALKTEDKPSAELSEIINELERLLAKPTENKNGIEKLVDAMVSTFNGALFGSSHAEGKKRGSTAHEMATECLKQGCPVETVEELLATLKAQGRKRQMEGYRQTAGLTETINGLEKLLKGNSSADLRPKVKDLEELLQPRRDRDGQYRQIMDAYLGDGDY